MNSALQTGLRVFLFIAGCLLCILAIAMIIPVGVNLPDSWFGLLDIAIAFLLGTVCFSVSLRRRGALRIAVPVLGAVLAIAGVASSAKTRMSDAGGVIGDVILLVGAMICCWVFLRLRKLSNRS